MAYSSGTFSLLVAYNPVVSGTTISSTAFNTTMTDVATGLSTALLKDGTQTATASIPFAQGISVGTNWVIDASGNLAVTTNKFVVTASSGNTTVGGTLGVTGATTLSAALTYGGVTLSNAVTGTGNMVLSASPTFTGTITAAAANYSGAVDVAGAFSVATNKFTVAAATGNTVVAGTLGVTGVATLSDNMKIAATKLLYLDGGGDTYLTEVSANVMQGVVGGIERFRWNASGCLKASNSGTYNGISGAYHELYQDNDTGVGIAVFKHAGATTANQAGVTMVLTGDPNTTTISFFTFIGNATERATIRTNGGLANYSANNVNLSDISVKEAIAPLEPSWAKVQGVRQSIQYFQYADATNKAEASSWCCSPMAQDVQVHFPEYVTSFSKGKLGVREQPLMWELMGNLIDEVAILKAKVGL